MESGVLAPLEGVFTLFVCVCKCGLQCPGMWRSGELAGLVLSQHTGHRDGTQVFTHPAVLLVLIY